MDILHKRKWGRALIDVYKKIRILFRSIVIQLKYAYYKKCGRLIPIQNSKKALGNQISDYWTGHTVYDEWFISARESMSWRKYVFEIYPRYREYADMDRSHEGEVILDYGCGPGNDLVWYTMIANPKSIIGMDVSLSALKNARFRMALHNISKKQCRLIRISETEGKIPLSSNSIDYISCQGVLMHTSFPDKILNEFHRILKDKVTMDCNVCIMVYNKESIHYHLFAPYYLKYIDGSLIKGYSQDEVQKMDDEEIFRRSVDGSECPMARCWSPEEFIFMCKRAGFTRVEYMGGYFFAPEVEIAKKYLKEAVNDQRLAKEHKEFLCKIKFDGNGEPIYNGKYCGRGGVYRLWR